MFDSDKANLVGLTESSAPNGLHVSHFVHKAFFEVNERGCEAGAECKDFDY